jgi:hypothetical protein
VGGHAGASAKPRPRKREAARVGGLRYAACVKRKEWCARFSVDGDKDGHIARYEESASV